MVPLTHTHKPPPCTCSEPGLLSKMVGSVTGALDRSNPIVKTRQDALLNVALFGAAVLLIHRYGHKLAV